MDTHTRVRSPVLQAAVTQWPPPLVGINQGLPHLADISPPAARTWRTSDQPQSSKHAQRVVGFPPGSCVNTLRGRQSLSHHTVPPSRTQQEGHSRQDKGWEFQG